VLHAAVTKTGYALIGMTGTELSDLHHVR